MRAMSFKASAFKLQMFSQCRLKYKLTYIDGLADQYKTAKPYLTMGAHVHNALKDFFELVPPEQRTVQRLEELLRLRWKQNRSGFESADEEKKWGTKALTMLRLFCARNDTKINPVMLEDYYDTDLTPEIKVLGRIDRVDEWEDGLHVIDYKTGKPSDEQPDPLQLILYSLIIRHQTHRPVHRASYLYLMDNRWVTIEPSDDDYRSLVDRIENEVGKIQAEKQFQPTMNSYCTHCDFLPICPLKTRIEQKGSEHQSAAATASLK